MGNLFYRGATPTEIESMGWTSIMYWGKWAELMNKADKKNMEAMNGGGNA